MIASPSTPPPAPTFESPRARKKVTISDVTPADGGPGREPLHRRRVPAGLFDELAPGGLLEGLARGALGVAGEARGELEDVRVDRLAPLLDEEEAILGRDGDDEDDAVDARALDELPAVADDEPQVPPGVELLHAGIQSEKTEPPPVADGAARPGCSRRGRGRRRRRR